MKKEDITKILKKYNFVPTPVIPRQYQKYVVYKEPLLIVCEKLPYRILARTLASGIVRHYLRNNEIKYPPTYIIKSQFIEHWKNNVFKNKTDVTDRWKKSSFLVFDGVDEFTSRAEFNYISEFIAPFLLKKKPLILISSGDFNTAEVKEYRGLSFYVLLKELKEIVID